MSQTENLPSIQNNNLMPSQSEFQMLQVIAKNAESSGFYVGVGQQSRIFMVILAARELGISPMLALNGGIWNIQGKIEISARLMNGLIRRGGHSIKIDSNDKQCTITGKRADSGEEHTETFTWEMALRAGLVRKNKDGSDGIWMKYPEDMLYNRCISRLARRLFSDVIGTAYIEGEIREAKEIEKLEQAECEEIAQPKQETKIDHFADAGKMATETKISFEDMTEFMKLYDRTNDIYKENFEKFMRDRWNITEFKNIPAKHFESCMASMARNIEMQAMTVNNADN